MDITAGLVKQLRERSGAGMMECKNALSENGGDIDAAMEHLRKTGLAKADRKAGRVAAEGRIALAQHGNKAVLVEINSETDFVAKDSNFLAFAECVAQAAIESDASDIESLKAVRLATGASIEETRQALVAKCGENVQVRRLSRIDAGVNLAAYLHGGRIGVLANLRGGSHEFARGIAMHIAAMNPAYLSLSHVPSEVAAKEKEIALAQMTEKDKSKPMEIQEKMVIGKVNKILSEMSLTGQSFVIDTNTTVEAALKKEGAEVLGFIRIAVGEGIEKVKEDYAAEVLKQAGLT